MPKKYEVTYKSRGKDIELPAERKRDPRLASPLSKVRQSLSALKGVADKAKQDSEEFKRRQR